MIGRPRPARLAACAAFALLLFPTLAGGQAGAGILTAFTAGPAVTLTSNDPFSQGAMSFPNPARAVNASVNVSTVFTFETLAAGPPGSAWLSEVPGCATLEGSLGPFRASAFDPAELGQVAALDGDAWSVGLVTGKPAVLLEFDALPFTDPMRSSPVVANITLAARTDGAGPADYHNLTVAFFSEPPSGRAGWREAAVVPDGSNASRLRATITHPPLVQDGPNWIFAVLVIPRNDSARSLDIDGVAIDVERPRLPYNPTLTVNGTSSVVWRYSSPTGAPAWFGRTTAFSAGTDSVVLPSDGTVVAGVTPETFLPSGSTITQAYLHLTPVPFAAAATGASAGTMYSAPPVSAAVAPGPISVTGLPIVAHPTYGALTVYNLSAHGILDARQEAFSSTQGVGNFTTFERSAAQTFSVVQDGAVEAVALNLLDATGHPVGPLVVEIRNASGGDPSGPTLATGSTNVTAARSGGWVNFTLSTPIPVRAGEVLAMVLASPGATAGQYWDWRETDGLTDVYAAGSTFLSTEAAGAGPWVVRPNDLAFRAILTTPFNTADAASLAVAGASGPGLRIDNYNGPSTGWQFAVPGASVGLTPTGGGLGRFDATFVNGLAYAISFEWDASVGYEIFPRNLELAVGSRAAFLNLAELSREELVDIRAELSAAILAGDVLSTTVNGAAMDKPTLRVRADLQAGVVVSGIDILYDATVRVTGFADALNARLAVAPPPDLTATASLLLLAGIVGQVRLSDLNVTYSEPPRYFAGPGAVIAEGSQNATVADLYQLFLDDLDGFALSYTVVSVIPAVATAAVWQNALDANLTVSMTVPEYSGSLFVTVRATDSTGLSTVSGPISVTVLQTDDPPLVPAALPDLVLLGATGTLNLAPFVSDNDTAVSSLVVNISSAFATVSGLNITFDYRGAPSILFSENLTIEVSDGSSVAISTLRVLINNAGRPLLSFPAQIRITVGHNTTIALDPLAADDRDADASLHWELLRVEGVGATPGDGSARLLSARALELLGTTAGALEVGLSVRDTDGNIASGTLHIVVVANREPAFAQLDGVMVTLKAGGQVRIDLSDYVSDPDDEFANLTFQIAWDNGTIVSADIVNGTLIVVPAGSRAGRATVTVTAIDPAGASDAASIHVNYEGSAVIGDAGTIELLIGVLAMVGIGLLLFLAYRKGQRDPSPLGSLQKEDADIQPDEEATRLTSPEGLERTDSERLKDKLDDMEQEASVERVEVPPVTILSPAGPLTASSLLLLYRDGRPMAWVAAQAPTDAEKELTEELTAVLQDRLRKTRSGDRIEGESVEMGGKKIVFEGRSQMVLAATLADAADEVAVRDRMREALDRVFDKNAVVLKRWEGTRSDLKGVDEALENVLGSP